MSEINVPSVTIPQMHDALTTLSETDLVPVVQGSKHTRDAAATLSEILASKPFQNQKEWKTFLLSAAALDTGTWTHNALVLLDAWESSISYSGTSIKNGIMILIPKWSAAPEGTTSCTFAETEGTTCQILRGNFLLIRFGLDGKIAAYFSIPASSVDATAQLKSLSVTDIVTAGLVNADNVNATNAVNATDVNATNIVNSANVIGDIIHSNNNITADNNITAANAVNAANVTATNAVTAVLVHADNVNADKVNVSSVVAAGRVNADNVNATGNVNAGDIIHSNNNITADNNITATNAVNANAVNATNIVTAASAAISGALTAGPVTAASATISGVTLLKGNTIQKGTLSSFSQAQSADRVAIATISVPAGAKLLFFERHTIGSSIPHSLGLYTDLSSASPVDTQAYETAGPISLMLGYTNSTDEPVTLYFRFGPISEGQTVSLTNINWNYLFM